MFLTKLNLKQKLILVSLMLGIVPIIITAVISVRSASTELLESSFRQLEAVQEIKKHQVEDFFDETKSDIEVYAYNSAVVMAANRFVTSYDKEGGIGGEEWTQWDGLHGPKFKVYMESYGYYDLYIISPEGEIVYTVTKESDLGKSLKKGPLANSSLAKAFAKGKSEIYISDFQYYEPSKGPAAFVAGPIADERTGFVGVLAYQLSVKKLNEIMQQRAGMGKTGETYLVGSDKLMRSDSYLDPENHSVAASFKNPEKGSVDTKATREALAGNEGEEIILDYNGNSVLSAYSPLTIGTHQWAVIAEIAEAEVLENVQQFIRSIVIAAIIIAIALAIIGYLFANSLSRPIVEMVQVAEKIAKGDLATNVEIKSKDEVGTLGNALKMMADSLRTIVGEIKDTTESVAASSEELTAVSGQMKMGAQGAADQSADVAAATEQMTTNINTMASAAEEMSVNANEVAGAAEQTSQNMNAVSSAVEEMSVSIGQIAQDAVQAREIAGKANASSDNATQTMGTLSEAAKEIGNVTEVIKRIAEQTNLLALNATIEAASAGEAGKGFAVVANEIKELANQSAQAADDIAARISGVQNNTDEAVNVIETVSDVINQIDTTVSNIANAVEQQSRAVNDISANVTQASTGTQNIAGAIAEVAKGANDVSRNSGEASKGANSVSKDIGEIKVAATAAVGGSGQVEQSATELAGMSGKLKEIVSRFSL